MKLFFNEDNKVDYDLIKEDTTVSDLLDAVDQFLSCYPLDCQNCKDNCCKQDLRVGLDNAFMQINSRGNLGYFLHKHNGKKFIYDVDALYRGVIPRLFMKQPCRYLSGINRCDIHKSRPLVCRLYMCHPASERFTLLCSLILGAFQNALGCEALEAIMELEITHLDPYMISNPTLKANDYNIPIRQVLSWAKKTVEPEEMEAYKTL